MNQKDYLLQLIGTMEGKVVPREVARQARGLAGAPEADPTIQLMMNQLVILLVESAGGEAVYTIDEIDDNTEGYYLMFEQVEYRGKPALKFFLRKKRG